MGKKILIAGETDSHSLEISYQSAFEAMGWEVVLFDTRNAVKKYVKPGGWAYKLHMFFPVEAWLRKANKELAEQAMLLKPDVVMIFSGAEVLPGTIAFIRSVLPATKVAWYWADPLTNMTRNFQASLPLLDLVASYSNSALTSLKLMGARKTCWIPFAGDGNIHRSDGSALPTLLYDLSFVGSWRPEREKVIRQVMEAFPGIRLRVTGPYWQRCEFKPLQKIAGNRPLYGSAFTEVVQQSLLSLNVMDTNNYPAVNMRFFEIISAGGAELCSAGPEMENIFRNREEVLYFSDQNTLREQIRYALDNKGIVENLKKQASTTLLKEHTYYHRAMALVQALQN